VHTAEALSDVQQCLREHRMGVVERWHQRGILGPRTLAAHCVHVSEREIDLLRDSKTAVVHNPQSNMANAVGCAPVPEMMLRGVRVGLGTDGYTADMFESMKAAGLLQKHNAGDPRAAFAEPPLMLFRENAIIASDHFGLALGMLAPGVAADIILVDYDPPTPIDAANLSGHILFGFTGRAVSTTIVAGRILMHGRKLLQIDESEVMAHARAAAAEVWKRF
jgi:cytosine/adenosine deaminase-related metal-dependent hydrolase